MELGLVGLLYSPLDFGFFRAARIVFPSERRKHADWFLQQYQRIREKLPTAKISVIAHSFGTYIVTTAIEIHPAIKFERIILCGSIVREDFDWNSIISTGQAKELLNEQGASDIVVLLAKFFIADAGRSGVYGFDVGQIPGVIQHLHHKYRHSDFFYALNYQQRWIPFLQGRGVTSPPPRKKKKVNLSFAAFILVMLAAMIVITVILYARLR